MNIMIKLIIYTPQDYVEAVTGHRYTFDKNICAEIGKRLEAVSYTHLTCRRLVECRSRGGAGA